jgi:diguanylate cyclase (GGDEF)-like protein
MDIDTLVFVLALGNLGLCAALLFIQHDPKKSLSLTTWTRARQCQTVAWSLLFVRSIIPEISVPVFATAGVLANLALFAGVALDAAAMWQAAGRNVWRRVLLPVLGASGAAWLACNVLGVAANLRVAASALIISGFALAAAAAVAMGWAGATRLRRFLVAALGFPGLAMALRGIYAAMLPEGGPLLTPETMQAAGLIAMYLLMLANGFGYLLLSREKLQDELVRQEIVDGVTGAPNRRGFYHALGPWMALARRPGLPTCLIVLKLDHFKRVNDSYGHPAGDVVLKAAVEACRKQLRDSDLIGRLGGAEFAVQLPRTMPADALVVAERLRAAIENTPVKTERAIIKLTASLGVTAIRAEDSTVSLFRRADDALQAARQGGRNRVAEAAPPSVLYA